MAWRAIMQGLVYCQTFLPAGCYRRYFIIYPGAEASAEALALYTICYKQQDLDLDPDQPRYPRDLRQQLEEELADIAIEEAEAAVTSNAL